MVLGYYVADVTSIPTSWSRFQDCKMPHEEHLEIFKPFPENTMLRNVALSVYYNQLRFKLDYESYQRCFSYSRFNPRFSWARHIVIKLE